VPCARTDARSIGEAHDAGRWAPENPAGVSAPVLPECPVPGSGDTAESAALQRARSKAHESPCAARWPMR